MRTPPLRFSRRSRRNIRAQRESGPAAAAGTALFLAACSVFLAACSAAAPEPPPTDFTPTDSTPTGSTSAAPNPTAPTSDPVPPSPDVPEPSGWLAGRSGDAGRLVLLGDSFAAGEGAGGYGPAVPGFRDSCHRSLYPVGTDLFAPQNIVNLACSRATTGHLHSRQQLVAGGSGRDAETMPAQLEQLQGLQLQGVEPSLVVLSVGGNDLDFAGLLQACLLDTLPCSEDPQLAEGAAGQLAALQPVLADAYARVAAAVTAPVLVLPYPQLFDAPQDGCGRLDPSEQAFARRLITDLNTTIRSAVDAVPAGNVFYVDAAEGALAGHGACSPDPYLHAANVSGLLEAAGSQAADQELLHPTRDGYRAMTRELVRWAAENPAPGAQ